MLFIENRKLLDRYRVGEKDALTEVYRHYAPAMAGFLRAGFSFDSAGRRCRYHGARSAFELEDRLHDLFSRAFSEGARLGYDGLSPFKTYLYSITRNLIIDDFRKKEHALLEYSIEPVEEAVQPVGGAATDPIRGELSPSGDPRIDAESAELLTLVEEFTEGLSPREQEVYRLRFVEELEHRDICKRTGLSDSKVKTSEQRIRERFFEFMQRRGYFEGYVQQNRGWLRFLRSWS